MQPFTTSSLMASPPSLDVPRVGTEPMRPSMVRPDAGERGLDPLGRTPHRHTARSCSTSSRDTCVGDPSSDSGRYSFAATPEVDHHVVVGAESDTGSLHEEGGASSFTVVRSLVRQPSPIHDAAAFARLAGLLRRLGPDLVVTHQSKAGVLGRLAARRAGLPTLHSLSMANFGPGYPAWQDALFRRVEVSLSRSTGAYAVVGTDLADRYSSAGIAKDKLTVIRSGVRLPTPAHCVPSAPACHELGLPVDSTVGAVPWQPRAEEGRARPDTAVPPDRRAAADLHPFLVVAGDGPLADQLRQDLRDYFPSDASMVGHVDDPRTLIASADVMVLLSRAEGVPQVLVQAAAAGTPFVAYEVDGVSELLAAGAEGTVVPQGDEVAAARAAARALAEGSVASAVPDLSQWSAAEIADRYRALVTALLGIPLEPIRLQRGSGVDASRSSSSWSARTVREPETA